MWAFFFSCTFCVLLMNAKGVFIVCVYQKVYWLLILNITHHLCSAPPALHHRHTPHITCLMVSAFLLAVCPAEITHQSKRWSRQLLTKGVLFLCSAPSALHHQPHITFTFRFWAFLFGVPLWLYLLNVKTAQKSILCVWEVFLCYVLCVLLSMFCSLCFILLSDLCMQITDAACQWMQIAHYLGVVKTPTPFTTTAVFRFWAFLCVCPCVSLRDF